MVKLQEMPVGLDWQLVKAGQTPGLGHTSRLAAMADGSSLRSTLSLLKLHSVGTPHDKWMSYRSRAPTWWDLLRRCCRLCRDWEAVPALLTTSSEVSTDPDPKLKLESLSALSARSIRQLLDACCDCPAKDAPTLPPIDFGSDARSKSGVLVDGSNDALRFAC
jgi:hypothetical protein